MPDLVLNEETLTPQIAADLERYFGVRELTIWDNDPTPGGIDRGGCLLRGIACDVGLFRTGDAGTPLLLLVARPDAEEAWTFGRCFPQIQDDAQTLSLGALSLGGEAVWVYSSPHPESADQTVKAHLADLLTGLGVNGAFASLTLETAGLHMAGTLPVPASLEDDLLLGAALREVLKTPVQATIDYSDDFPVLRVPIPLNTSIAFPGDLGRLTVERLLLSAPLYQSLRASAVRLEASLELGDTTFEVRADYPLDEDRWSATITVDGALPFVDEAVFGLTLPEVEALAMELQFSKSEKTLKRVQFDLGLDLSGQDGIRTFLPDALAFRFILYDPFDAAARALIATINGQVSIEQEGKDPALLALRAGYPDGQFTLALDPETPLYLAPLFQTLVPDLAASDLPDGVIDELDFEFNWNGPVYLQAALARWKIVDELTLERLRFTFQHVREAQRFEIAADLTLCDVPVRLSGQYATGQGWRLAGGTGPGAAIPIGKLVEEITGADVPDVIADLTISDLGVSYDTGTKNFSFTCKSQIPVGGADDVAITVAIDCEREADSYTNKYAGSVTFGDLQFALRFSKDKSSKSLVAAFQEEGGTKLDVKALLEPVVGDIDGLDGLSITLKYALFAYEKSETQSQYLFGLAVDIGAGLDPSGLPLVGEQLPSDQKIGLDDLQIVVASKPFAQDAVETLNTLLADGAAGAAPQLPGTALKKGVTVAAKMNFGATSERLALPLGSDAQEPGGDGAAASSGPQDPAAAQEAEEKEPAQAVGVQKSFGPVQLRKVGLAYEDGVVWVELDAALTAAGLTLSLDGLAFGSPLSAFDPQFKLNGFGVAYDGGGVLTVSGAFLRGKDANGRDQYAGAALIETEALTLSAVGAYGQTAQGSASMFLYGVLDYPLGGPPFFFVTGLALGFGYNRRLIVPTIDEVERFPLITAATAGKSADPLAASLAMLEQLNPYLPPADGEAFLAVGVRFTSFKMIDSFALLTASFGERFELNLMGLSTLTVPTPEAGKAVTPLARVRVALLARYRPDEGALMVDGKILPGSYVYTPDCKLSGGFAFYSWFSGDHEGDFVLTVGGYHPRFAVPAHYPKVERLALNWEIDSHISVKGRAYFALTASALMAGGSLEAVYSSGAFKAWFKMGVDFLIAWKPYYYDAAMYIRIGASYTFKLDLGFLGSISKTISVEIGADLRIWGPPFSGTATIDLSIISFTVKFGADASKKPDLISWDTFQESFLPKKEEVCTLAARSGLLNTVENGAGELWVVNPRDFALAAETVIPFTETNQSLQDDAEGKELAIRSVGATTLTSRFEVEITGPQADGFAFSAIQKNVPAALWGPPEAKTDLNGERFIEGALAGVEIRPNPPPPPDNTAAIDRENLTFNLDVRQGDGYRWGTPLDSDKGVFETVDDLLDAFGLTSYVRGEEAVPA